MKLTERLLEDHATLRRILTHIDSIAAVPDRRVANARLIRLVELLAEHSAVHAWVEETFYYSILRREIRWRPSGGPPLDARGIVAHDRSAVDVLLLELEESVKARPRSPDWRSRYEALSQCLLAQMEREEAEIFPLSEKLLGDKRLSALFGELQRRRSEAPKRVLPS